MWLLYAVGSAFFASLTAILGKIGISSVESNLGTAIRTCVVLIMAWGMVFVTGKQKEAARIGKRKWRLSVSPVWPRARPGSAIIGRFRRDRPAL